MPIPKDILKQGAFELGIDLSPKQLDQFELFADLLVEWNNKFNLTRITDPQEIVTKHFLDSLTCFKATQFPDNAQVIDVGTGPGIPGIPLKIVRSDISLVLLDSVRKKLTFLEEVVHQLELTSVETVHARAEDAGHDPKLREKHDVVIARALGKLPSLVELCLPLAKVRGVVLAMKGPEVAEELESAKRAIALLGGKIERVVEPSLPGTDAGRSIVVLKKIRPTIAKYPRKPADIEQAAL